MKKTVLFLIIALATFLAQSGDFVTYVKEIIVENHGQRRCGFTGTGEDLLVEIQRDNEESLTFKLLDRNLEPFKQFTISGLQADEEAIKLWSESFDKEHCYVSRYFFNDDDKYEVVIGRSTGGNYEFNNVRIINEDGELLGSLDFNWEGRYTSIGSKHYLMKEDSHNSAAGYYYYYTYYSIDNQTGKPLEDSKYDVNRDAKIDVNDVTNLINKILGKI